MLLCLFLSAPEVCAQYRFDVWTADNGLPQNSIHAIHQTPDGYLWLTTSDGLVRFDGVRFSVFNKGNSPGINSNRFTGLYADRAGALWFGTENGGVTRYQAGRFTTWTTQHGLTSNWVRGVYGDAQGGLWVLSDNQVMRWAEGRFERVAPEPFLPQVEEEGGGVIAGRGGLWGVGGGRLARFVNGEVTSWTRQDGLPSLKINAVAEDCQGTLWAATRDAGLFSIDCNQVLKVYRAGQGLPGDWAWLVHAPFNSGLKAVSKDRDGALWITDLVSWQSRLLIRQPPADLVNLGYYRFFEDREGNLWIGSEGGGLYRARAQAIIVYSEQEGLGHRNVYPVVADHDGGVWAGTVSLSRIKDGAVTVYTAENSGLGRGYGGLYTDRAGKLWAGTELGVQVFAAGRFTTVSALHALTRSPDIVMAMCEDAQGNFWLGGRRGKLIRYRDGVPVVYTARDGLLGEEIKVIIADAAGALWIGAYGGLTRFKDGQFTGWTEHDGLPSNSIRALYSDRDGALWIGTYDSGLGRFKDGQFTRYTTREGLFNNGVFQILEDELGYFWMSSNRGIYRVSKQELNDFAAGRRSNINSIAYGKSDGMLNAECNGGYWPAGARTPDGRLWFPTQDGVAVLDPATMPYNPQPPPVVIESLLVDRAPVAFDRPVRIKPGRQNFEITYTALSFISSAQVRFKYKLEGLDSDWNDVGARRAAYYSYVPPGDYAFKVIAANSDGVWNNEGQSLRITVLPPFYRTWWFSLLAALAVTGAALWTYRYRIAKFQRRQQQQELFARQLIESQEAERQRIAAELHDGLGQHLIIIKNWAALGLNFTEPAAPVREQLGEISSTALVALNEVRGIVHNLRPYQLDAIGLTNTIKFMLEQVAAASGINFTIKLAALDKLFAPADEVTFYRVVQECINNLVKHAQATAAQVLIEREGRNVRLTITDDGRGFVPATVRQENRRGGFGLAGLQERVRMLGGELALRSAPGNGTHISINIKVKQESEVG